MILVNFDNGTKRLPPRTNEIVLLIILPLVNGMPQRKIKEILISPNCDSLTTINKDLLNKLQYDRTNTTHN